MMWLDSAAVSQQEGKRDMAVLPMRDGVSPSCVVLPQGTWPTVLECFASRFPTVAHAEWSARMQRGEVVDMHGVPICPDRPYRPHLRVFYYRSLPPEEPVPFEERIVYVDDDLLVADKPHFLSVTPSGRYLQETLLVRLKRKTGIDTLSPAHRIDRETAGLVLFTIRPGLRDAYQSLFRDRTVEKTYEAIAPWRAELSWPATICNRLVSGDSFMRMAVEEDPSAGAPNAETRIELIERNGPLARYRLRPLTGQKHQLRVQMAALGIPIVNDRIYPVHLPERAADGSYLPTDYANPLRLLASSLAFRDPISGAHREFTVGRTLPW